MALSFLLSWAVLLRRAVLEGVRAILTREDALFSGVALAAGVISLFFRISGDWYFINPAMFVSLPFVASAASRRIGAMSAVVPRIMAVAVVGIVALILVRGNLGHTGVFLKRRISVPAAERDENIETLLAMRDLNRDRPVVFEREPSFPGRSIS